VHFALRSIFLLKDRREEVSSPLPFFLSPQGKNGIKLDYAAAAAFWEGKGEGKKRKAGNLPADSHSIVRGSQGERRERGRSRVFDSLRLCPNPCREKRGKLAER